MADDVFVGTPAHSPEPIVAMRVRVDVKTVSFRKPEFQYFLPRLFVVVVIHCGFGGRVISSYYTHGIEKNIPKCDAAMTSLNNTNAESRHNQTSGSVFAVLLAFLKLGLTSFGGPLAH